MKSEEKYLKSFKCKKSKSMQGEYLYISCFHQRVASLAPAPDPDIYTPIWSEEEWVGKSSWQQGHKHTLKYFVFDLLFTAKIMFDGLVYNFRCFTYYKCLNYDIWINLQTLCKVRTSADQDWTGLAGLQSARASAWEQLSAELTSSSDRGWPRVREAGYSEHTDLLQHTSSASLTCE